MDRDQILDRLDVCESRLVENLRSTQEVLDQLREIRRSITDEQSGMLPDRLPSSLPTEQRQEIVQAVFDAMGFASDTRPRDLHLLIRDDVDHSYKVGRRRLNLTDTEAQIMDMLWHGAPSPVSRDEIHASLYLGEVKPSAGVIDVFLSKLRQKLKLASNGHEYLESVRGRGWSLRTDLCGRGNAI